ncbi:MAG: DUF3160 domain-containing protein [Methanomicrobiaceae archaeon]|nr:DUF3160 domain-containing protein [Methanomicrobiaceae archaeon]
MNARTLLFLAAIFAAVITAACVQTAQPGALQPLAAEAVNLSGANTTVTGFAQYYASPELAIDAGVPAYDLPLALQSVANYGDVASEIPLGADAESLLAQHGFVVIANPFNPQEEDIIRPYTIVQERQLPVFITSDSLLHLYHIQFDETLRRIEEREFYDAIWQVSDHLLQESLAVYAGAEGDAKEAARRNAAFCAVGLSLLTPQPDQIIPEEDAWAYEATHFSREEADRYRVSVPAAVRGEVEAELALIEAHGGFAPSPLLHYDEDYSQYIPRGHYTRSEKLKNYFRAMMWYGRMTFLLKGGTPDALVSAEDARIQTAGATQITAAMAADPATQALWDRVYTVTAFYVGFSDDLGVYEYLEAMNRVFGGTFDPAAVREDEVAALKAELAAYRSPQIYGGTGNCQIPPPYSPEQADRCLESTRGFRLMGQRFIPDSYLFSRLVGPYTGAYSGTGQPFTLVGSTRGFPMGLDVMALLGSERARAILDETGNDDYALYDARYAELEAEFANFTVADWNRNLYWSWLYSLKPLLADVGPGYPAFMQGEAWQDKQLNCALASWTELRHDTILYSKQSYTMEATAMPPEEQQQPVVGYVEPVPEFYHRLLALTRMTSAGLEEMEVLDEASKARLNRLEAVLKRLEEISVRELENERLAEDDYAFIRNFGDELEGVIADVDDQAKKTTIVADVHTDANSRMVLEEGVGYVDMIIVAYPLPDGRILCGAGPVMTYHEFTHPMAERLNDEQWRAMLETDPPARPGWTASFAA